MKLGNPNTEFITSGLPEDEDRLAKIIEAEPERTIVMFPSPDAVVFSEFLAKASTRDDVAVLAELVQKSSLTQTPPAPPNSSEQAKKTQKRMNGMPTVHQTSGNSLCVSATSHAVVCLAAV